MSRARLPLDADAWTNVDRRIDREPVTHDVCCVCSEWALTAEMCAGMCPDCLRRDDEAMSEFLRDTPFPPSPDGTPALLGSVASSGLGPSASDAVARIARAAAGVMSRPLVSAVARVAIVGIAVAGWSYFFALAVLP